MKTKTLYLILALIGFIAPNILVLVESVNTGNILLYTNPIATIDGMFANNISTIFLIDLLFTVLVFFIWTYIDGKKHKVKQISLVWVLTMFFGLAGGFPLYLYFKEKESEYA